MTREAGAREGEAVRGWRFGVIAAWRVCGPAAYLVLVSVAERGWIAYIAALLLLIGSALAWLTPTNGETA